MTRDVMVASAVAASAHRYWLIPMASRARSAGSSGGGIREAAQNQTITRVGANPTSVSRSVRPGFDGTTMARAMTVSVRASRVGCIDSTRLNATIPANEAQ